MKVKDTTINAARVSLTAYYDDHAVTRSIPATQLREEYPEWEVKELTDVETPATPTADSGHRKSSPRNTTTATIVITQPK